MEQSGVTRGEYVRACEKGAMRFDRARRLFKMLGGVWLASWPLGLIHLEAGAGLRCRYQPSQRFQKFRAGRAAIPMRSSCS